MRTISLPSSDKIILSDTVGFISDLPTQLVKAFRATLEEVTQADMILHVRDIAHTDTDIQKNDVMNVLRDIGVLETVPIIEVFNKTDLILEQENGEEYLRAHLLKNEEDDIQTVTCSALKENGIDDVKNIIQAFLDKSKKRYEMSLAPSDGAALSALYRLGDIISRHDDEDGQIHIEINIEQKNLGALKKQFPYLQF